MKKVSVSIGIPAYNEEANIKRLLQSLLAQKRKNYSLKEIIVVSDSSSDGTVEELRSVKSKKIVLIKNRYRSGQAVSQNKIIKIFKGEILVLLNADVLPENENFISELIKPFKNKSVGLTGPRIVPVSPKTYFEDIINFSIKMKEVIFESCNKGNNLYLCSGRGRAFSREFAKQIIWKESLSEDAYSFLFCLQQGYKFKYTSKAKLLFKSPDNFKDHIKQSARFLTGSNVLSESFDRDTLKRHYKIPLSKAVPLTLLFCVTNPIKFLSYCLLLTFIKFSPGKNKYAKSQWQPSVSSKALS